MSLLDKLHDVPLWRPQIVPPAGAHIVLICNREHLHLTGGLFKDYAVRLIILAHDRGQGISQIEFEDADGKTCSIPASTDINRIKDFPEAYIVRFGPSYNHRDLCFPLISLARHGVRHVHVCMPIPNNQGITSTHLPLFLEQHREELERAFALMADQASRSVFASRLKAMLTGNVGFAEISLYEEYFHPLTAPREGDIILDGGVSEWVYMEQKMADMIGPGGHIWSFEPDPVGLAAAAEKLKDCRNLTLLPFGLWKECCSMNFNSIGQGSHVVDGRNEAANIVTCHMVSIDAMVKEYSLDKVDLIKLDVEGAEKEAIMGGLKTIARHRPRMLISVYHKPNDLFELPLLIDNLGLDYDFYLGHHQPVLHETILYANPRKR